MEEVDITSMLTGDLTKSYAHWWVCCIEYAWACMTASATELSMPKSFTVIWSLLDLQAKMSQMKIHVSMLQHSSSYFLSTRAMSCGCNHPSMDFAHLDAGACRTDQHTVLWRVDEALLGQDEPFFKLHYSRPGNLKLTGMSYCSWLCSFCLWVVACRNNRGCSTWYVTALVNSQPERSWEPQTSNTAIACAIIRCFSHRRRCNRC